jgi:hypothetical protein
MHFEVIALNLVCQVDWLLSTSIKKEQHQTNKQRNKQTNKQTSKQKTKTTTKKALSGVTFYSNCIQLVFFQIFSPLLLTRMFFGGS